MKKAKTDEEELRNEEEEGEEEGNVSKSPATFMFVCVRACVSVHQLQLQSSNPATRGSRLMSRSHRVTTRPGELEHGSDTTHKHNIRHIHICL